MTSQVVKYIILSVTVDVGDMWAPRFGKPWKEGTCLFDINIKHNTEIFIGKIISGDSH